MIDTNTLYLIIAILVAIVLVVGLVKSDRFRATVKKGKFDLDAGKNPEKSQTRIKKVKGKSEIDVTQKDGHEVEIEEIEGSKITVRK